jgi:transposase
MGVDRKTVRKVIDQDDFSDTVERHVQKHASKDKLAKAKPDIRRMLDEEGAWFHKQRYTAVRMQELLVTQLGYGELAHSYHLIRRYMNWYRGQKDRQSLAAPGTMPLVWHPGETQADFGEADCRAPDGNLVRLKYLILAFAYSNRLLCVFLPGESCECVCQGLQYFFEYLGRVPGMILFDNATGIGKRVFDAMHETELFIRFRMHYGFSARFANIEAGWEKGCVENAVGTFRRNRMVPPCQVTYPLEQYDLDTMLPLSFAFRVRKGHYAKGSTTADLFATDSRAMHSLPAKRFNVEMIDQAGLNATGTMVTDGKHRYVLGPQHANQQVLVGRTAWKLRLYGLDGRLACEFDRQYGKEPTQVYDIQALLGPLSCKPNAWPNSPVREAMEDGGFRSYLDRAGGKERRRGLYLLWMSAQRYGFPVSSCALNALCHDGKVPDRDDVNTLCNRMLTFPLGKSDNDNGLHLERFDALLTGGKGAGDGIHEA